MNLMTISDYARHRHVSQPMISKLVKEDRILVTEDGKVDQEISDLLLDGFSESPLRNPQPNATDPRDALRAKLENVVDYATQRALLTQYKAELAKLELEKSQGKLIDRASTEHAAFTTARRTRDAALRISDRLATILAAETDPTKIRNMLDEEIRQALEELANEFTQTPNPDL